jgi:tetratricopeptide (TPR) repeat protein
LALETIPSFSLSKHTGLREEEEDEESDIEDEGYEFSVLNSSNGMMQTEEVKVNDKVCRVSFGNKEMYLAKGLGVDVSGDGIDGGCRGGNGGGDYSSMGSRGNDGDSNHGVEEYYKKMVQQNPGNSLFLRNYAQFLYQSKKDREGAEEYYSRAILADPNDGEVLSQYGKLVWELHHDEERATSYFERAVQASPDDSHVQAAYASFLWDTEEDEDASSNDPQCLPQHFHFGAMATSGAS